jgi:hypothetical protein
MEAGRCCTEVTARPPFVAVPRPAYPAGPWAVPAMLRRSSIRRRCRRSVASSLVRQDIAQGAHVDPATARRAVYEMLPLVLRLASKPFADNLARHGARTVGRSICSHEIEAARKMPLSTPKAASLFSSPVYF